MNRTITKIDRNAIESMTDTLLAARKNNLKEVLEIAHRLEKVGVINEVEYINDSKSTNVNATLYSLECMVRPVVWIVSGSDWEQDYSPLNDLVKQKVKGIVCIEQSGVPSTFDFASFGVESSVQSSLAAAIEQARVWAKSGEAVLFSPAHPSELCYDSYKERGEQFKSFVNQIQNS